MHMLLHTDTIVMVESFRKKNADIQDVFQIIRLTKIGRVIYRDFLKEYMNKKVKICHYPVDLVNRMNTKNQFEYEPNGACFVTDGAHGTIYFDPQCESIVLAIFLIHEMSHSLDHSIWNLAKIRDSENKEEIILHSEWNAFKNQFKFLEELEKEAPGTKQYLKSQYPQIKILHDEFNDQTLIQNHYKIKIAS